MTYDEFRIEWLSDNDSIACHTSGSTGIPKCIMLPKTLVLASALRTIGHFGLNSSSHLHSCISPDFIGGKMMLVRAEEAGCRLTHETPSNRPLRSFIDYPVDLLAVVPSQMVDLCSRAELGEIKVKEIRHIIIGGAPIDANLRRRIEVLGFDAWETYGMTETASHIALRRVKENPEPFEILSGIEIWADKEERLNIKLPETESIVTNDIVRIEADGRFRILGRKDNVIISGGKKIHPEAVEAILERELQCEVLITSEPDSLWGERVVLTVEDVDKTDIEIERAVGMLESWERPKKIKRERIVRTANGKKCRKSIAQ